MVRSRFVVRVKEIAWEKVILSHKSKHFFIRHIVVLWAGSMEGEYEYGLHVFIGLLSGT